MIKKSYFIQTYNLNQFLGAVLLLTLIFFMLSKTIAVYAETETSTLSLVHFQAIMFRKLVFSLQWISIVTSVLLIFLLLVEIIQRLKHDSLLNLGKSYFGTLRFRRFLTHAQQLPKSTNPFDEKGQTENKSITRFNRAVRKSVLDLTQDQLTLFLKVPKEAQAQKILNEHEEQIKEHLASFYSEYIISTFERKKFTLWLIGTKRT